MPSRILKAVNALAESVAVVEIMTSDRIIDANKTARAVKLACKTMVIIMAPLLFLRMVFAKSDPAEAKFIFETLQKALSYSEWKYFDDIWESVKDDLPPSYRRRGEKQQQDLMQMLVFLSEIGIISKRLENKAEYVEHLIDEAPLEILREADSGYEMVDGEMKPEDKERFRSQLSARYDLLTKDATYYEQIHNGLELVFQRKPMGTTKKTSFFSPSLAPSFKY